ncbi:DUF5062 family protein [Shewanella marina]|uniref:DUF5062 family protein n=1 Tax=Shewanella marina TaxID=487319 RepID=UPI00047123E2|nr:DUF5062 family protein [Shewanella marina]
MKKIKHEAQLFKLALEIGEGYAMKRGYKTFPQGLSNRDKIECIYRLLINDKLITPLPEDKEDGPNMKHRLIIWITRQLPENHELLQD